MIGLGDIRRRVWHELGHMSKPDAQRGYVALVSASQPQWQQWKLESGGGGAGAAGPVFSKPVQQQTGNGALETTSQAVSCYFHTLVLFTFLSTVFCYRGGPCEC